MNALQDPSKKTSITSLLNPQDVSAFSSMAALPSGVPPHHVHPHAHAAQFYHPEYQQASYSLRAAIFPENGAQSPDDSMRRKALQVNEPRYPGQLHESQHTQHPQHPQMPSRSSTHAYVSSSPRVIRPRMEESQGYAPEGAVWHQHAHQQHDSFSMSYGSPVIASMYSDERTALSGDYTSPGINYPSSYDNSHAGNSQSSTAWQTTERASVRLAARGTSAQPMGGAQGDRYTQPDYYQTARMYDSSMEQQPQQQPQQIDVSMASSSSQRLDSIRPSGSTSSKRSHPDSEGTPAPKAKRTKAKPKQAGSENSTATGGSSKRGYNAKKRSEAAFISAQNDALQRIQRDATYGRDTSNGSNTSGDDHGTGEQFYVPELQFARCMSNRYRNEEFPRCVSCTRRWAGDTCRFQGIRFFMRDAQRNLLAVSFNEHHSASQATVMEYPAKWNRSLGKEHVTRTKLSIAKALLPTLKAEQEHVKANEIVRRPRESDVRVTCDTCMTSLFSTSFMCRLCGREVCNECFQQVRELTQEPMHATPAELAAYTGRREKHAHANPFFLNCLKRNEHGINEFTPVTRFVGAELDKAVIDMQEILDRENGSQTDASPTLPVSANDQQPDPQHGASVAPDAQPPPESHLSSSISTDTRTKSAYPNDSSTNPLSLPLYDDYTPSNVPESIVSIPIYRLQIIPASLYDVPEAPLSYPDKPSVAFSTLWEQGVPLLVKDILPRFKLRWTPEYFMERYGEQTCLIVECQTDENKRVNVRDFFAMFGKYAERKGCWKLKDWPPTAEFKTAFPELFKDFSQAVPVPDYVRRDGVYNIGSHFPTNALGPDLGPKMYNALASSQDVGSKGSTRLHMDMADALNVMLHATPCEDGSEGYAVWDLFRAEDSDKIRAFLKKRSGFARPGANGSAGTAGAKKGAGAAGSSAQGQGSGSSGNGSSTAAGEKASAPAPAAPPLAQIIGHDPIHGQQFYLDINLRRQLFEEYGVKSYRVYQRPGDGVFIPAGCAHQVANMADCMKIAIDFVSPENIDRCERLTREFREQNQSKVWKEDVLQLRTMMWFAWQSCTRREAELEKEHDAGQAEPASSASAAMEQVAQ